MSAPRYAVVVAWILVTASACADTDSGAPDPEPSAAPTPSEGVVGRVADAVGGVPSVVLLRGPTGSDAAMGTTPPNTPVIDQLGLQFTPRRLVVRVGEPVQIKNSEAIAHNVRLTSEDGTTAFSADTPPGEATTFVFEREGGYDVLCDIHPGMTAFVYATITPFATFADDQGRFHLSDVPAGDYTLEVWSLDPAARGTRPIAVANGRATELSLIPTN